MIEFCFGISFVTLICCVCLALFRLHRYQENLAQSHKNQLDDFTRTIERLVEKCLQDPHQAQLHSYERSAKLQIPTGQNTESLLGLNDPMSPEIPPESAQSDYGLIR